MTTHPDIVRIIDGMQIPWNSPVNTMDVHDAIFRHAAAAKKMPSRFAWSLVDGVLLADGKPVERVGPKERISTSDDAADYWEGRILERQERWMD